MKRIIAKVKAIFSKKEAAEPVHIPLPTVTPEVVEPKVEKKPQQPRKPKQSTETKRKPGPKKEVPGDVKTTPPKRKRKPRSKPVNQNGR
jgi:hypothetical protein